MVGLGTITGLVSSYGLAIVAPIAVIEGPIVTVIAAWLASQGLISLGPLVVVVVLADLIGDVGFYALGRWGLNRLPPRFLARLGLTRPRLEGLTGHFERMGGRSLILGKITHSAGFAVLAAAGMAKMPLGRFLWFNLLGTIPKSLFFVAIGYAFGEAYGTIDSWITKATLGMGVLIVAVLATLFIRRMSRA